VSCSQIVDIEDFVLGTIDDDRAAELRQHVRACEACRAEAELVKAERALFEGREAVMIGPPPELEVAIAAQVAIVTTPIAARVGAQVVQLFRRGHFSAACAAALFVVASLSRLGGGGLAGSTVASGAGDRENEASEILASMSSDEPLACSGSSSGSFRSSGSGAMASSDDRMSEGGSSSFLASLGSVQTQTQVLACAPAGSQSTCESSSSVTCASFRQ
jgi:hypothetical protein